ncbi:LOW QUALITY PROTEIN: hypothetical protein ACHAXS_003541 [Conticribra weissflogii]
MLVYYSPMGYNNPTTMNKSKNLGLKIAMGRIDEPSGFNTFHLGLYGLDKMGDIPKCVCTLDPALDSVLADNHQVIPKKTVA